jgi:predicted SPOUT superfamily RNA methylase MTH1
MKTKVAVIATLIFLSTSHLSEAANYSNPQYRGYSLDWCLTFENSCGKPAADAFCKAKGHLDALNFSKKDNPGVATMTIGNNAICDPQHHRCDSFNFINCRENMPKRFDQPKYRGYRLDWCLMFENNCGKPAADAFCKANGFTMAKSFEIDQNVQGRTMIISNNAICDPAHHSCDSFKFISCQ